MPFPKVKSTPAADVPLRWLWSESCRVEMRRGGCRSNISVSASFVWRCLSSATMTPLARQSGPGRCQSDGEKPPFAMAITSPARRPR
jgi:hypothetical protein